MKLRNWSSRRAIWIVLPQIVVLLVIVFVVSQMAFAEADSSASPLAKRTFIGLPEVSTFGIQTLPDATTSITITESLSNGTVIDIVSETIPAETVRIYTSTGDLAYIEANQQIFGTNFELSEEGNDAYLGLEWIELTTIRSSAANGLTFDLFLPQVMRLNNGWTATFALQNESDIVTANVFVGFYDQSGYFGGEPLIIPPGGNVIFDLGNLPAGFSGSAVISSDQEVAVASVRVYNEVRGLRAAYPGISTYEVDETLVAPALFKDIDGQTSQLCVQNAGINMETVTVDYSDGTSVNEPIEPGVSHCFDQGTDIPVNEWQGGAIISSNSPLAAVVNVTAYEDDLPTGRWSYTASATQDVGQAIALPLVFTRFEGNGGEWNSDIYLYNFGDSESMVTPRYSFTPAHFIYCGEPFTIPAGQMRSISLDSLPPWFGPGMAYFSATQPVAVATSVTDRNAIPGDTDLYFGYEAAYPEEPISFLDNCDVIYENLLPLVSHD